MDWVIFAPMLVGGLFVGSFLNVVVHRGPALWGLVDSESSVTDECELDRGDFAAPRSYCPSCRKPIPPTRLIPVLSYVQLKGKCGDCGATISWRYPIIELLGAVVVAACLYRFGVSTEAVLASLYGWTLIALAFIDLETRYLPDALTFPLIVGGVAMNTVDLFAAWPDAIIGAIAGYGAFWLVRTVFSALRGVEGLGLGDAKLLSAIGAWVGWQALPAVVFIGAVSSLAAIAAARLRGDAFDERAPIAFGPGLALAGFAALVAPVALY